MAATKDQELLGRSRKETNQPQPEDAVCPLCYSLDLGERQKIYKQQNPLLSRSLFYEDRQFKDVKQSAQRGCQFCSLICQASSLLSFPDPDRSDVVFNSDVPTLIRFHYSTEAKSKVQLEVYIYPRKLLIR